MTETNKQKLKDYLHGFVGLTAPKGVPIGAIIIAEKDRKDVNEVLIASDVPVVLVSADQHPDEILRDIMKQLRLNIPVALNIIELHPKILNQLRLLVEERRMVATLAGREDVYVFRPGTTAQLFCVFTQDQFEASPARDIPSSFCRLG